MTEPLEKVCITRSAKDRVSISISSWILFNIYLAHKHFCWVGAEQKSSAVVQEKIAKALIQNQFLGEEDTPDRDSNEDNAPHNDTADCQKLPQYKKNICRHCYKHKTIYICKKCRSPQSGKIRKDRGPKGGVKVNQTEYMHFCRHNGCFAVHKCRKFPKRRPKAQVK